MALNPALWARRVEITAPVPLATLTGFVGYLNEDSLPAEIFTRALNGGGDIRICTDSAGVNQLPLQIVNFDTVGNTAQIWFRWNSLASATRTIWVFYDKAAETQPLVTDPFGRNAVWQDYAHRLGGNGQTDVTGATTTTLVGSISQSGFVNGFNAINTAGGLDSYLRFNSTSGENWTGDLTFSAWVRPIALTQPFGQIIGIREANIWEVSYRLENSKPAFLIGGSSPESSSSVSVNTDVFLTATVSGTLISYYINGVLTDTKTVSGTRTNRSQHLTVNGAPTGNSGSTIFARTANAGGINGVARSASHIKTEYDNQISPSSYWTVGTPENTSGGASVTSNVNFTIAKPVFNASASAIAPAFNSAVNFIIDKPIFNAIASSIAPVFTSAINTSVSKPVFNVTASNIAQGVNASVSIDISKPVFNAAAENTAPEFNASVNYSIPAPLFNIAAGNVAANVNSAISFTVSKPVFNATGSNTLPLGSAVFLTIDKPVFNAVATNTIPELDALIALNISAPIFSVEASNQISGNVSNVNFTLQSPIFNASASITIPSFNASVGIDLQAPTFRIFAGTDADVYYYANGTQIDLTTKTRKINLITTSRKVRI